MAGLPIFLVPAFFNRSGCIVKRGLILPHIPASVRWVSSAQEPQGPVHRPVRLSNGDKPAFRQHRTRNEKLSGDADGEPSPPSERTLSPRHPASESVPHQKKRWNSPKPQLSPPQRNQPAWRTHRETLRTNFPSGWNPPKKLSREAMTLLRSLHQSNPAQFTTPVLAEKFKISPEAVRRILKSRWVPAEGKLEKMREKVEQAKVERRKEWKEQEEAEIEELRRRFQTGEELVPEVEVKGRGRIVG